MRTACGTDSDPEADGSISGSGGLRCCVVLAIGAKSGDEAALKVEPGNCSCWSAVVCGGCKCGAGQAASPAPKVWLRSRTDDPEPEKAMLLSFVFNCFVSLEPSEFSNVPKTGFPLPGPLGGSPAEPPCAPRGAIGICGAPPTAFATCTPCPCCSDASSGDGGCNA